MTISRKVTYIHFYFGRQITLHCITFTSNKSYEMYNAITVLVKIIVIPVIISGRARINKLIFDPG